MSIAEFEPAPPLTEHVASYWGMTAPGDVRPNSVQSLPPDGSITLLAQRTFRGDVRAALIGPRTEPLSLPVGPGDRLWAVRFWPDAGGAVLGEDPRRLSGHFVSPLSQPPWAVTLLRSLAGCSDRASAAGIANELLEAPVGAVALDAAVRLAVRALIVTHGEMSIAEVASGIGLSLRQLERRFLAAVGLNPIQFARIRRMRGDLGPLMGAAPVTWSGIAGELEKVRP